jgi:hypothetical protein
MTHYGVLWVTWLASQVAYQHASSILYMLQEMDIKISCSEAPTPPTLNGKSQALIGSYVFFFGFPHVLQSFFSVRMSWGFSVRNLGFRCSQLEFQHLRNDIRIETSQA